MGLKYTCIVCNKQLDTYGYLHPDSGLTFTTYGHYGSTYFDPMDGSRLHIFVCDECLEKHEEKTVMHVEAKEND